MMNEHLDYTEDDILIRPMREEDVHAVWTIEDISFPEPWSRHSFEKEVHNPSSRYVVAENNGKIVGYIGMLMAAGEAHITTFAVDPDYRKQGIGRRLLFKLMSLAAQLDAVFVTLEVRASNVAARHLYESFGFRPVGLRRNYYTMTGEDAIIMDSPSLHSPEYRRFLLKENN